MKNSYRTLCNIIRQIGETRGKHAKTEICAQYLKSLENKRDLHLAARFIGEGAFDKISGKRASVGSRTSGLAAARFCEIDYEIVFKPCKAATGNSHEAIEKLMEATPAARRKRQPAELTLEEISRIFEDLYNARSGAEKQQILLDTWQKMTPAEIKYFLWMAGRGSLKIGFEARLLGSAIAGAFGKDPEAVHYAYMITGSAGETAVLAREDKLDDALFRLFHPLPFMLASGADIHQTEDFQNYVAEEKFDGMRCQLHIADNKVSIFSRDLSDVTSEFPEVTNLYHKKTLPPLVLDGVLCVYKDETLLPNRLLQKRRQLKKPGEKVLQQYPVLFIAFDLLYISGRPVFDLPWQKRRTLLESASNKHQIPVTGRYTVENTDQLEQIFNRTLARGNEGLILKKKNSTYEYGQRSNAWLKVQKPGDSLITVIMYAHYERGQRGGVCSEFTLGVSVKNDERFGEEFIPIGKISGGIPDDDLEKINNKIKELTAEKYGPTRGLIPGIVLEIEFGDILVNKRTKAGLALHLPGFKTYRGDLGPADVYSLMDIEKLIRRKTDIKRLRQINQKGLTGINWGNDV